MTCTSCTDGVEYVQGAELPDLHITWLDSDGDLIDFSGGWAFEAKVGRRGHPAVVTKTSGITGAAAAPNAVVQWDADQLEGLAPGRWVFQLRARSAGRDRMMQVPLSIVRAVT